MAAKTLVAAIAALFTVSAPASAQKWQGGATRCPTGPPAPGQLFFPCPPQPPQSHPPPGPPPRPPQQVYPQQVYPQFVYPPFVGLCVVTEAFTCEVFRAPGSYCECKNWLGEVFSGTVQ